MSYFKVFCSNIVSILLVLVVLLPGGVWGNCACDVEDEKHNKRESLKFKLAAIASVLVAGVIGVSLPQLGKKNPWGKFPFTGFIAMISSIGTLMVDSFATNFYKRMHLKHKQVNADEEIMADEQHIHAQTHASHSHAHVSATPSNEMESSELIRHRIISQVLELGIIVHSVIIGISLGASQSPSTIKPLLAALSFHQFFEGMGLGGCILQAKFKSLSTMIMALFFSLTTPVGIAIGIGISNIYNENSQTALIVEGIFNAASAGILIYMALVDLLASDFTNPRMQEDRRIQVGANVSLLLGAGCMSVMARWA